MRGPRPASTDPITSPPRSPPCLAQYQQHHIGGRGAERQRMPNSCRLASPSTPARCRAQAQQQRHRTEHAHRPLHLLRIERAGNRLLELHYFRNADSARWRGLVRTAPADARGGPTVRMKKQSRTRCVPLQVRYINVGVGGSVSR